LGLSLAKRLIELMGGRIWLESELARGTTFYFNARFGIDHAMTAETAQSAVTSARAAPQLKAIPVAPKSYEIATRNLRLLVVDDSADNRSLIKAYLKKMPWKFEFAENGAEAVTFFTSQVFDVVLMDIQMPVMDGNTATRTIREWERQHGHARTPVIALTASVLKDDQIRTLEAGCDLHLTKPL
jgi:CheY-like chemotaxis protein